MIYPSFSDISTSSKLKVLTITFVTEISDIQVSWAGWAWSFVPSILPSAWDEDWNREQEQAQSGHTLQIGFYVDNASVTFKVWTSLNYFAFKASFYCNFRYRKRQMTEGITRNISWNIGRYLLCIFKGFTVKLSCTALNGWMLMLV